MDKESKELRTTHLDHVKVPWNIRRKYKNLQQNHFTIKLVKLLTILL